MPRVHLIGICGTAMATLAALLKHRGFTVSGSDQAVYPPMSDFLAAEGIAILEGYRAEHIGDDLELVVIGNAISRGNAELETVLDRKLRYTSLPEAFRDHFLWDAQSIVIAGTHGKTTTTSLAGWLLTAGGADPTVVVGGIARNFGEGGASYRIGRPGGPVVIEGDEYDSAFFDKTAKFLKYLPDIAVIGNIEFDHADIYASLDEIRQAFRRLVNLVPRRGLTVLGADSPDAAALVALAQSRVQTFGMCEGADWQISGLAPAGAPGTPGAAETVFVVRRERRDLGQFVVPLLGAHNVRNAVAALVVGVECGIGLEDLRRGLASFAGVRRRLEVVGERNGVRVYDDFAHHPTAVAETLAAVRAAEPGRRVWAIFEPRSASSCRRIFQADFARALAGADEIVIAPVYRSALPAAERLSEEALVSDLTARGVSARHLPSVDAIVEVVGTLARPGDLLVVMSNGGFGGIHRRLLGAL